MRARVLRVDGSFPLWFGLVLAIAVSYLERRFEPAGAVDRALIRDNFGLLLPVVAYALFQRATDRGRLDARMVGILRRGGSGRRALLGATAWLAGALVITGTAFAVGTVMVARGSDVGLWSDLTASAWIGGLAGAAYAAWFALASSFGRHGSGRKWLLAFDLLLGSSSGALALLWPRAHIANLLGAEPLLGLSQRAATALLLLSTAFACALAVRRAPK